MNKRKRVIIAISGILIFFISYMSLRSNNKEIVKTNTNETREKIESTLVASKTIKPNITNTEEPIKATSTPKPTELRKVTYKDYLNNGTHNFTIPTEEEYWVEIGDLIDIPEVSTANIKPILQGIFLGHDNCIFATEKFNKRFKGYFPNVKGVIFYDIDHYNREVFCGITLENGDKFNIRFIFTIQDSLIDDIIFK